MQPGHGELRLVGDHPRQIRQCLLLDLDCFGGEGGLIVVVGGFLSLFLVLVFSEEAVLASVRVGGTWPGVHGKVYSSSQICLV